VLLDQVAGSPRQAAMEPDCAKKSGANAPSFKRPYDAPNPRHAMAGLTEKI